LGNANLVAGILSRAASFSLAIEFLPIRPIGRGDNQVWLDG
jgi:hypothetical protein